jgi:hypothetical protein
MSQLNIFTGLLSLQEKHAAFFTANHKTIIDYLLIDWEHQPSKVRIMDPDISLTLRGDIESLLPNFGND